jgi:hypothetical protein
MRNLITTAVIAVLLIFLFVSCDKKGIIDSPTEQPEPLGKATMKRLYKVSGTIRHDTSYVLDDSLQTSATYSHNGRFYLGITSKERKAGYIDGIYFDIDTAMLKGKLTGTHSLNQNDYPNRWNSLYFLVYIHPNKAEEWRGALADFGYDIKGELKITGYDEQTQLIYGSYKVEVGNLNFYIDRPYTVLTKEPASVILEGTFSDVKVKK